MNELHDDREKKLEKAQSHTNSKSSTSAMGNMTIRNNTTNNMFKTKDVVVESVDLLGHN